MRLFLFALVWYFNFLSLARGERSFAKQICREFSEKVQKCGHLKEDLVESEAATVGEFPHVCWIGHEGDTSVDRYRCSGSLISERFVLSAARCLEVYGKLAKYVIIGDVHRGQTNNNTQSFEIIERYKHPLHDESKKENDIALFKLDRNVLLNNFVRPICLPTSDLKPDKAIMTAWGLNSYSGAFDPKLKKMTMDIISEDECQESYTNVDYETKICGKPRLGGNSTFLCILDPGAPLQIYNTDGFDCMYTIVGLTSSSFYCEIGVPTVYTRVYPYVGWIESIIAPPKNQNLSCPAEEVRGHNIISTCKFDDEEVKCEGNLQFETEAKTKCKLGYKTLSPKKKQKTVCLADTTWSEPMIYCSPKCGIMNKKIALELIVGGQKTNNTEIPWNVAIYRNDLYICGGTIISDKVIVSAAHCFFRLLSNNKVRKENPSIFKVAAGKYFNDVNAEEALEPQFFDVSEIRALEGYRGYLGHFSTDIALLVLANNIQFNSYISPVCLDYDHKMGSHSNLPIGQTGVLAGFGWTEFDNPGNISRELKTLNMPVVSHSVCQETSDDFEIFITSDKFCAGSFNGDGACRGDSGGGLVFPQRVGGTTAYYLRGLVSNTRMMASGVGGCDVFFYTLFTNIHFYISFIEEVVREFA